ncbi:zinc finger CCCH domain-containing protein 43 [Vigna radiata var. radiata]|uniref:Zinc finger CCCH domain-containing protein 43 n=1 Tax=Vigna radiata var. radiata TaxID=3916 RepID=A0A1S3UVU8_VIGRR|nr:zinc finger CCCH domain-containing protein 43 [Vigna radiata var. radiata]
MEASESDSAPLSISNGEDPQLGASSPPPSPPPQSSDLNHAAEHVILSAELQSKLDLKVEDESEGKVSDLNDGGGVCDEETAKGDGDSRGSESNSWNEDVGVGADEDGVGIGDVHGDDGEETKEDRNSDVTHHYPLRPEAEDCAFYMKTGNCKFGFNCKFNHPIRRKTQAIREKAGEREEPTDRSSSTECKYYQRSGGCKFGKSCKYNHTRGKISTTPAPVPVFELNFLGLPIRQGERECPYYMRTGSCKFGANCKFNHPDPTVGGCDPPSGFGNGGPISLQGVSRPSVPSWSSPRSLNEASPFVPMMLSPTQGVSTQSSDWNGYQASVYLPERNMHPPSSFVLNNPAVDTNVYLHHQKQMSVEEFPERPGEPECSYFLKTGDCKFKSNCKFHHPKNRISRLPPCNLSDKGLPLRPDQSVCSHYSRYGICKFGPACKFDHPINLQPLMMSGLGDQSYSNSASVEVPGIGETTAETDVTIQQSV